MTQHNYQGALQHPLRTGFDATSTADDVISGIDLSGRTAIVTGGNTGIGLETARSLAVAGATVIVPARDVQKAAKNLEGIPNIEIEAIDMMDPWSIEGFTTKFLSSQRPLHLLINNAGIMWVPFRHDRRGIESQLATNFIGQFHLTAKLWPALRMANGARVVNVSSLGHHLSPFNFEDPNFEYRSYETLIAYGQSKTASNLFALELDNRAKKHHVRAYSVHPGSIGGTELAREAPPELFHQMGFLDEEGSLRADVLAALKNIPQGAATTVWAATSPALDQIGGVYCEDGDIAELIPDDSNMPTKARIHENGVMEYSLDEKAAKRLWRFAETMTGMRFDIQ
ncbi:SDR family NAD(P)-dependent oxidoreductase [Flavihumibacter petaseus]|uniref:Putative oxidoreductase n=1 Tax=Flavihumibacter petaseus NBRC 106054 TaxID=1220578 RepID=A0A0E9N3T4_9BACT|nr:SDR family NAD(P)-dependent oxidoreductase [Flavihumibacter petaseus]GAO44020.1 putative oxidoreductase [Flavihumibacter petaseus NBRC 106054]